MQLDACIKQYKGVITVQDKTLSPTLPPRGTLQVVRPLDVELPRSLGMVVTSWNLSMHRFLKYCEWEVVQPYHGDTSGKEEVKCRAASLRMAEQPVGHLLCVCAVVGSCHSN